MPDYSNKIFFLGIVYLFTLLAGSTFILTATDLAFLPEFWLFAAIIYLPLVVFALYHYHSRFPSLWPYKGWIKNASVILMIASIVFSLIFIIPLLILAG